MLTVRESEIRWQGVTVDFPLRRLRAIQDISLEVQGGEVLAVMGPSGCGKSTLLKTAAGLVSPKAGTVQLGAKPISSPSRQIALVFQEAALFPWFTVERNIDLALARTISRNERTTQVSRLLATVGLTDFGHVFPRELSGGMARRAALAAALARDPAALLLDEPFSGLDVTSRRKLARELAGIIANRALTTILVTHSVDETLMLADRVVVLTGRPGRVRTSVPVGLPHPRQGNEPELAEVRTRLYNILETEE
ncbi:MAG: ABC transporter ATP-binding protein [Desulforudis sp.]|nr:MAG: ABC transporter ATP-binding protein [Desulforudis sp.]